MSLVNNINLFNFTLFLVFIIKNNNKEYVTYLVTYFMFYLYYTLYKEAIMNNKINEIVIELLNYNNKKNLSWLEVLKELLKEKDLEYNDKNVNMVIKELSKRGYDIIIFPFKLEKYR